MYLFVLVYFLMESKENIITALNSMKNIMSRINIGNDAILLSIKTHIEQYIIEHCDHNIVYDYIDIAPECGHTIKFCDLCMKTFN